MPARPLRPWHTLRASGASGGPSRVPRDHWRSVFLLAARFPRLYLFLFLFLFFNKFKKLKSKPARTLAVVQRVFSFFHFFLVYSYSHTAYLDYGGAPFHPCFPSAVRSPRGGAAGCRLELSFALRPRMVHTMRTKGITEEKSPKKESQHPHSPRLRMPGRRAWVETAAFPGGAQLLRLRPPLLFPLPALADLPLRHLAPCVFPRRGQPSHIGGGEEV